MNRATQIRIVAGVCVAGIVVLAETLRPTASADGRSRARDLAGQSVGSTTTEEPPNAPRLQPAVARALKRLLSERAADQTAGTRALRKIGVEAIPELRAWLRHEGRRLERVRLILDQLVADLGEARPPVEPLTRDFSAEEYFRRKLEHARIHLRAGRYKKAREIAASILELDPGSPLKFPLTRLVRECRERMMQRKLEPRVDVGQLVYEVGDEPEVWFRLYNRSPGVARVSIQSGVVGELYIEAERRYQFGNGAESKDRLPLRIDDRASMLVLQPGEFWEHRILDPGVVRVLQDLPLREFVGRCKFRATFRPTQWEIEDEEDSNIPLTTRSAEFWVVPPGKRLAFEDPVRRLTTATLLRRGEDFLIAGWFSVWAGEKDRELNGRLVDRLVSSLSEVPPELQRLTGEFLRSATGRRFDKPDEWVAWWTKEKASSAETKGGAVDKAVWGDLEPLE